MFQLFLASIFSLILMKILRNEYTYWSMRNVRTFSRFYFENFIPTKRENLRQATKIYTYYGSFRLFNKILTIKNIDLVQHIFKNNRDGIGRSFNIHPGSSIMKKILPHLDYSNWKRVKSLMIRGFSSKKLKHYQTIVDGITKDRFNSVIQFFYFEIILFFNFSCPIYPFSSMHNDKINFFFDILYLSSKRF